MSRYFIETNRSFISLSVLSICTIFSILLVVESCQLSNRFRYTNTKNNITDDQNQQPDIVDYDSIISCNQPNISNDDLIVLLHIQKTGGTTFERHLVQDLIIDPPCICDEGKRRCNCPRYTTIMNNSSSLSDYTWLVSRFSTGWICGLHPDFSQLKDCLNHAGRLYFLTFLRHPLNRFISEFRHVQRGATWKASKYHCQFRGTQSCYESQKDWSNATLEEFLGCKHNMAINRQTKMLANYDELTCNNSTYEENLLSSAKATVRRLAYFGICDRQRESQLIFEKTFNLKFRRDFRQSEDNKTQVMISKLPGDIVDQIIRVNNLDMRLYDYALSLFANRSSKLINGHKEV